MNIKSIEYRTVEVPEVTKVKFRKFPEGDVIALFPEEEADLRGNCMSYMCIGQHGAASPELIEELTPATPAEYKAIKEELERIGYHLSVEQ